MPPSQPNPLLVLDAFWRHSHDGLLHIESIVAATKLFRDDCCQCSTGSGVFRLSGFSEDVWECLLTPPSALGDWAKR
jgi:hypothetical protein